MSANLQYFLDQALGGRHELRFGIDHAYMPTDVENTRIDDLNLFWNSVSNQGTEVALFNSPVTSKANVSNTAVFGQDTYIFKRLTVTGGVRWERFEAYLPEQSSPPSRWFPDLPREFGAMHNAVNWKNAAPRINVVYDLFGDGKTALKVAAGRYHTAQSTNLANNVNPNFTVTERYVWNDLNRDLRFQVGEAGRLLSRTGGASTVYADGIKRPIIDEIAGTIERELMANMRLSVVFTYREEKDNFGNIDVGVPFSAFSPTTMTDPGRDGILGTTDDVRDFVVYNQDPATLGLNRIVITNSPLFDQTYRGLEIIASKRMSRRWQMLASYTVSRAIRVGADPPGGTSPLTPNSLINAGGPVNFDRTHTFKLTGGYVLPRGIEVSGNFRSQTGVPLTRQVQFRLNQGNETVNAEARGNSRLDPLTTIDARLSKVFRFAGNRQLEGMLDLYNLTNANTVYNARTLTGRLVVQRGGEPSGAVLNQPQFLSPLSILNPRIIRLAMAYRF